MSLSWNFPARASPNYEVSSSSEPELGHFNFWAETELKFFLPRKSEFYILIKNQSNFPILCPTMIIIIFMLIFMNLCKTIGVFELKILWHILRLIIFQPYLLVKEMKIKISARFGHFSISSWKQKGHVPSRAELKILHLELWLEPAQLGLIITS